MSGVGKASGLGIRHTNGGNYLVATATFWKYVTAPTVDVTAPTTKK